MVCSVPWRGGSLVVNLLHTLEAIFCISPGRAKFTVYRDGSTCSRGLNSKDILVHANLNEPAQWRSLQELCSKFRGRFNVLF
jgi:hypothetical protein